MKQSSNQEVTKNERAEPIKVQTKGQALEYMVAATQILTIICLVKENTAWRGTLSLFLSQHSVTF